MTIDTQSLKEKLVQEKNKLEQELTQVGRKNPEDPSDWDATTPEKPADLAEEGDVAEQLEEFDNNSAEVGQLEIQLKDVMDALARIENGTYGICEVGGEQIEEDRLEANPSARTCKTHMN